MIDLTKHEKKIPSFRFVPAISVAVGELINLNKKDRKKVRTVKEMEDKCGKSFKFWNKDTNPIFYYPNFLITGGHFFKKSQVHLNEFQLFEKDKSNQLIVGDSGGHQIAVGALKYTDDIRQNILDFLENNSNFGIQLDIPTHKNSDFKFSLEKTTENIKYFHENRQNKTSFVNVLQGRSLQEIQQWYDSVSKYQFEGWAVASFDKSITKLLLKIIVLLENKEFENKDYKLLHILGTSRLNFMPLIYVIQEEIRKINPNITVSIDSSQPTRNRINGTLLEGWNKSARGLTLRDVTVTNRWNDDLLKKANLDAPFYVRSPVVNALDIRLKDVFAVGSEWNQYEWSPYHNTYIMIKAKHYIDRVMHTNFDAIMDDCIHPKLSLFVKMIREIFNSSKPLKTFNKYKHVLSIESAFNGTESNKAIENTITEMF